MNVKYVCVFIAGFIVFVLAVIEVVSICWIYGKHCIILLIYKYENVLF